MNGSTVISSAIHTAIGRCNGNVLLFAAASNLGSSTYELFPAEHAQVFSIRGTDAKGTHAQFNPSLPPRGGKVFGTLGVEVPARGIGHTGTSVATAIMSAIAAIILGYISVHREQEWREIRRYRGFENLLYELSTEPDGQKHYITLDRHSSTQDEHRLKYKLSKASD